jgi:hypothetical protein
MPAATSTTDAIPSVEVAGAGARSPRLSGPKASSAPTISRQQAHRQQHRKDQNGETPERGQDRSGLAPADGAADERGPANPVAAPLALPLGGTTASIPSGPDVADPSQIGVPDVNALREQITANVPNPRNRSRP